jgi:two-component system response regulator
MSKKALQNDILLVEDSESDVLMVREALSNLSDTLHVVEDGVEAMSFLRQEGKYSQASLPQLVILDLNLPKKDGRQVLKEIKGDPDLRLIPVVVLTTSSDEEDIMKSYGLNANCFITKPVEFHNFVAAIRSVENFWMNVATLPIAHA